MTTSDIDREIRRVNRKWPLVLSILTCPLWLPFACCFCGPMLFKRRGSAGCVVGQEARRKQEREVEEQLQREIPYPLPIVRERALSIAADAVGGVEVSAQLQSAMFGKLPLEMREIIYKYYLGGDEGVCRHIVRRTDNRLGYGLCTGNTSHHWMLPLQWGYDGFSCTGAWKRSDGGGDNFLALLKTCRRIYSEAIDLLYITNIFCFHDPLSFRYFSQLQNTIPQRFSNISKIQLPWLPELHDKETAVRQVLEILSRVEFPDSLSEIRFLEADDDALQLWSLRHFSFVVEMNPLEDLIGGIERFSQDRGISVFIYGEQASTFLRHRDETTIANRWSAFTEVGLS